MNLTLKNSDIVGTFSSLLCVAHCLLTPLLFLSQAQVISSIEAVPLWWKVINFLFLIISFFAVNRSVQKSSNTLIKYLLFISWSFLTLLIINEELSLFESAEIYTYAAAISLAGLHIYNLKYCQCDDEECCVQNK